MQPSLTAAQRVGCGEFNDNETNSPLLIGERSRGFCELIYPAARQPNVSAYAQLPALFAAQPAVHTRPADQAADSIAPRPLRTAQLS